MYFRIQKKIKNILHKSRENVSIGIILFLMPNSTFLRISFPGRKRLQLRFNFFLYRKANKISYSITYGIFILKLISIYLPE